LGMLQWWLEHDIPYPADYMARVFYDLSVAGILTTQGLAVPDLGDLPPAPRPSLTVRP
jgi:hypothetical protein